ncbi:MAG: DUF4175 family protein [Flavobacteriales bacterium]
MGEGIDLLKKKLESFIRKYYKNQMIKGLIYSVALILGVYLVFTISEYFGNFGKGMRTFFFYTLVLGSLGILGKYIIIPLTKLLKIGKSLSYEQASEIVGNHFPDVKDKLLNTLQLAEQHGDSSLLSSELLEASINQRTDQLKPVPFTSAVNFNENRKYLKWALIPVSALVLLLFVNSSLITESTDRIVRHNEEIIYAPYDFIIQNSRLEVPENKDFELELSVNLNNTAKGGVPDQVYILRGDQRFLLSKDGKTKFYYTFNNVQKTIPFRFEANGIISEEYNLESLPVPGFTDFSVYIDYPGYTGLKDELISNSGDMTVPQGSKLQWKINTKNASSVNLQMNAEDVKLDQSGENVFEYNHLALQNASYIFKSANNTSIEGDSMRYSVSVIKDLYPDITVNEQADSLSKKHLYFTGEVSDDYGFKTLTFNYSFSKTTDSLKSENKPVRINLPVSKNQTADGFFYHWSLEELNLLPGEELNYYFQVWDNDGVNGSKSSKSRPAIFEVPSLDEIEDNKEAQNEEIKDEMKDAVDDAKKLQKDLDQLRKELLQKEEMNWQDEKKLEDILQRQKELQNKVNYIQDKNEQKNQQENEFQQPNESIMEKQEQLQKMFDEIMTDEMKELYEQIQEMMEQLDKEEIQEQLEEMSMSNEDMEKELDRAMEQFKQLEWELKMEDTIEKLEDLAKKQEELAEETKKGEKSTEELKEEQDKLNEEFEKLQEDLDELEEMNEKLENPNSMMDSETEEESIKEDMENSSEELEKEKNDKAGESQDGASEKMEEMAAQMKQMMAQEEEESMEEDMDALRTLLENIIDLSFDQEDLMADIKTTSKSDPKYVTHGQTQRKFKDDARIIEDSLFALSKRIVQLEAIVNREINLVNENMLKSIDFIADRQTDQVTTRQQYVVTSLNNLALLLQEVLQQMQEQQAQNMPGTGNCQKPGGKGSKPSASEMRKQQEGMKGQMEKMKKQLEKEGKEGKPGAQSGQMSKQLAQQAAKQAAIRKELQKMGDKLNEDGSGNGNELKKIAKEMEELEKDLVNKRLDQNTINRQQDIVTRLLKHENAERQREQDNKRKSNESTDPPVSSPTEYRKYLEERAREIEMLKTTPPSLKPYYKEKVNEYFNNLER